MEVPDDQLPQQNRFGVLSVRLCARITPVKCRFRRDFLTSRFTVNGWLRRWNNSVSNPAWLGLDHDPHGEARGKELCRDASLPNLFHIDLLDALPCT